MTFPGDDGRAVIHLFQNSDVSTFQHEMAHIWRRNLSGMKLAAVERALGVKDGEWTVKHEEEFVKQFEAWRAKGIAPTNELTGAFEHHRKYAQELYEGLSNSPLSKDINPNLVDFFERSYGRDAVGAIVLPPARIKELSKRVEDALENGRDIDDLVDELGPDLALDIDTDAGLVLDAVEDMVRPALNRLRQGEGGTAKMSMKLVESTADILGTTPDQLAARMRKQAGSMVDIEANMVAARMVLKSLTDKFVIAAKKAELNKGDAARAEALFLADKITDLFTTMQATRTRVARTMRAQQIRTKAAYLDEAVVAELVALRGGRKSVDKMLKAVQMTRGDAKGIRRIIGETGFWDVINEYRVNALLSSPKTAAVNFISTALHTMLLPAERIIGGGMSGNLEAVREGFAIYAGMARSLRDSFMMASKSLLTEDAVLDSVTFLDAPKFAISSKAFEQGGSLLGTGIDALGKVIRMPSRGLMAADEFFKQMSYRGYAYQKITQNAMRLGLKGDNLANYVAKNFEAAFNEAGRGIRNDALAYAREATFTTPLKQGLGFQLQKAAAAHPSLRLIVPFIRTPTNLITGVIERTPLVGGMLDKVRADFAAGGVRRSNAVGKWAVGGTLYATAITFAMEGRITGSGPSDPDLLKLKKATGWQPYSFVTTDEQGRKKYISYSRLDPFASFLGLAADFTDKGGDLSEEDSDNFAAVALGAIFDNLTSKTYLTGIIDLMATISDTDRRLNKYMGRMGASFIPSVLKHVNPDPYMREARGLLDTMQSRIPGKSDELPTQRNIFGDAIEKLPGFGIDVLSPFAKSEEDDSPASHELARLGHRFRMPQNTMHGVDLRTLKSDRGQQLYDRMLQLMGTSTSEGKTMKKALSNMIQSPEYQQLPDDGDGIEPTGRISAINRIMTGYRHLARQRLLAENPALKELIIAAREQNILGRTPVTN